MIDHSDIVLKALQYNCEFHLMLGLFVSKEFNNLKIPITPTPLEFPDA